MKTVVWSDIFANAVERGTLFRAILSRSLASGAVQKVTVRPVRIRNEIHYQWSARVGPQERHENLSAETVLQRVTQQFGVAWGDLHWFADDGDYTVRWKPPGKPVLKRKPPSQAAAPVDSHNRTRQYIIPDGQPCPFLIAAGLMTPTGQVKPTAFHKFRQINRYLEFIADILPHLPSDGVIRVVDFGCGKSSLTFALHHFLTAIRHRQVEIVGLDRKADVIAACNEAARKLNCAGLKFEVGDIAGYQPEGAVHLAISLHACDTATDDALAAAIRWYSSVILAVPCCQHELCHHWPGALPGLTGYGLLKDRFAAMATDALRARMLDCHGYKTQVLEFIDLEHTPKNVLIRAVRTKESAAEWALAHAAYEELKRELGVTTWHLESALAR
ncbi:MAG TPA: SAM-dependent methyltransferase [Planctomycetaceae bacterium]|nr:SAM-dependent methyltransferase [Planctomycetaceae bacterium]